MRMAQVYSIGLIFLILFCVTQCDIHTKEETNSREITDFQGRKVLIPDTINRIICIRPGCVRLVTMGGGISFISGVEEGEISDARFTHTKAFPEIKQLDVIGPRFGGDPELILGNAPDLIFMTTTTADAADALQEKLRIPVVTLEAGDLGNNYDQFCHSLQLIGEVLGTTTHTDSLLAYIEDQKQQLRGRIPDSDGVKTYIGAITYKGERDLTATDPYYPALTFIGTENVAAGVDSSKVSPITGTFVDFEQIIQWDPDYIFVDRGGVALVDRDFRTRPAIGALLKAYRDNQIYMVWPYNNYHNNFEVMLLNAWYMGKCIYPESFADVNIRDKGNEIFYQCYGVPIFDEMEEYWGSYRQLDYSKPPAESTTVKSLFH